MHKTKSQYRFALWLVLGLAVCTALLISGPASAFGLLIPTPIPTQMANITIGVSLANPVVQAGDTFDINITVNSDHPSRGAQAQLTFDPKLVQVTGVEQGDYYKRWAAANSASSALVPPKPKIDNEKGMVELTGVVLLSAPGKGPTGMGILLVVHAKALPGVSGTANFTLDQLVVSDTGDVNGTTAEYGGVKKQDGLVTVGAGQAAATPTAVAVTIEPTVLQPTVERRATQAPADPSNGGFGGSLGLLLIAVPVVGAVVIGGGAFIVMRRRK